MSARPKPATSDVVGTAILAAVGAAALIMGIGYGIFEEGGQVGPGFLPVFTGGFILAASLAEIARMYFSRAQRGHSLLDVAETVEEEAKAAIGHTHGRDNTEDGGHVDTFGRTSTERNWAIVKVFGVLLVALLMTPVIGLLLSLMGMALTIVLWVERKPLVPALLATGGGFVAMYLIFVQFLGVPVPQGMLGLI